MEYVKQTEWVAAEAEPNPEPNPVEQLETKESVEPSLQQNKVALCLIVVNPNTVHLDFLSQFHRYDVYVLIDNQDFDCSDVQVQYPHIHFVKINNEDCIKSGFTNTVYITFFKPVIGWDKALYFFACVCETYEHIWFMEDDVFFYGETTLHNIDIKYTDCDILCNSSFEPANLNEWLWNRIDIRFSPPYFCGMMCITRFSKKMMESIKDYATTHRTLFFLEALFPTIAVKYNLAFCSNPPEFLTVTFRGKHEMCLLSTENLYHPFKDWDDHVRARNLLAVSQEGEKVKEEEMEEVMEAKMEEVMEAKMEEVMEAKMEKE